MIFWDALQPSGICIQDRGLAGSRLGADVGLLTVEPTSPAPRLRPSDQPYIGATATVPDARRRGVGRALVDAARAHEQAYEWISVDFEAANPAVAPVLAGRRFRPTGYGLLRFIDPMHAASAE